MGRLDTEITADAGAVADLAEMVAHYCSCQGVPKQQVFEVRTCLSEALNNVIQHAYGDAEGAIRLQCMITESEISLRISDHAPRAQLRPRAVDGTEDESGRGLHILRNWMDDVRIDARDEGNTLFLVKYR